MSFNISSRPEEEREKINVDLAASGVAYKERMNMPVVAVQVEEQQPEALREYFRERLAMYRQEAMKLPKGTDPVYAKEEGK
ncbi:DNA polymerase III subunit theta [Tatumella morbirosei]|uniref:DNA polymerase III subunit theta n=1 Tax=Tatumella morbirosei TaxID=642227 RepID=A0A095VKU8_9GAMM|nr:DNA polymerase III subunit theta [Tatumella morbirosei]KGD75240.1 DNA polymerase III subunit theta [Tatumella morbirosei]